MKIDVDFNCIKCGSEVETLDHIFINCSATNTFINLLNTYICNKLLPTYRDDDKYYFITCQHENKLINYMNLIGKWFLSRCFQTGMEINWHNFVRIIKKMLCGDNKLISEPILAALGSDLGS